ncbi:LpxL/LpxP family Kdo(2)-lipid IV(A) lauroyl/palmitoleoyl acyltransferase [Pseudoalteromonas sp. T1lg65]|uniref:LpxL/LpxP family Kdo(2)-lipid IV(A) lauroyl/palmitoleoyl acyltransferase n=1 Tax=Pseudoalteromonas sp. T1lg65 TaxID=2077101 RepID=UPI003F7A80E5
MVNHSPFKWSFLTPKFWPTWLGVLFLYLVSWLPQQWQLSLGRGLGHLVYKYMKKRRHVARVNLALCFPELSEQERETILRKNMENTGIATLETGMAWWWPEWRIKRVVGSIKGLEHVKAIQNQGKGAILLVPHMLHLEMAGRVLGTEMQGVGFYRPHNNPLMEFFMTRGRLRSNEYLVSKRDVKGLLKTLANKRLCYYLPDQDYGRKRCEFAPFFAVPDAATTTGTLLFASSKNAETVSLHCTRDDKGLYHLEIQPMMENFPSGNDLADVSRVNKRMEQAIMCAPEQYMWLHRRFKTRPDKNAPSLY